jgi:hypothetical protein
MSDCKVIMGVTLEYMTEVMNTTYLQGTIEVCPERLRETTRILISIMSFQLQFEPGTS